MIRIKGMIDGKSIDVEITNEDPEGLARYVATYTAAVFRMTVEQAPAIIDWVSKHVPDVVKQILDQAESNVPLYVKLGHQLEQRMKRIGDLYSKAYSSLMRKEKAS